MYKILKIQRLQRLCGFSNTFKRNYSQFNSLNRIFPGVCSNVSYQYVFNCNHYRKINYSTINEEKLVDSVVFEQVCEETLESLSDYFEELLEKTNNLPAADVSYSGGVLTLSLGSKFGTYVINRQSPNRQIWLSSPTSGPKRYDFVVSQNYWIYKHDSQSLHSLLQHEFSKIITDCDVDFSHCSYSKV